MKKIVILLIFLLGCGAASATNCGQASPIDSPNFCTSFKNVARCHCIANGMHERLCENVNLIYKLMMNRYKSLENACRSQQDTTVQKCVESWNCYLSGGKNSEGRLCSNTGARCTN